MNFLKHIGITLQHPMPAPLYYGQWMVCANYLVAYFRTPNSEYPLPLVVAGLCALNVLLNLYQVYTAQSLAGNPTFGDLEPELAEHIMSRARLHNVTVTNKQLVTNLPTINAFCARLRHNTEIIISHHWFESEEGKKNLRIILEHEFGHAVHNHQLKRALFSSACYIVMTVSMFSLYALPILNWTYGCHVVIGFSLLASAIFAHAQAWYNRSTEFEADTFGAHATSPQEMQDALLFLESKHPGDAIFSYLPEWKQGTHPKMFNRIARLETLKGDLR